MIRPIAIACILIAAAPAAAQVQQITDALGDATPRRTDPGVDGFLDEITHGMPDLVGITIGRWQPVNPQLDRYNGAWANTGEFLRLDLVFTGLVNPPGPVGLSGTYDPYQYGPSPVFGYIELDVDASAETGGEVSFPQHRYLAHVARFGGYPSHPRFQGRVATLGQHLDGDLLTSPYVERSGEEFHLALFGDDINSITGNVPGDDFIFDAGETWLVQGRLLHRAHAFEPFSGSNGNGSYEPLVELRFQHAIDAGTTTITMVYPLTNFAAAQLDPNGLPPGNVQPMDSNHFNHTSIQEGLHSLISGLAAIPPLDPRRSLPGFALVAGWENQDSAAFLNAHDWYVTACVGMAYQDELDASLLYVPTDVAPSPVFGDFDGDGLVSDSDVALFDAFVADHDADGFVDGDNQLDGMVQLTNFGPNFSMFDLDYSGTVDAFDRGWIGIMGDLDFDMDVDEIDAIFFVQLLLGGGSAIDPTTADPQVFRCDFDFNGILDGRDIEGFVNAFLMG